MKFGLVLASVLLTVPGVAHARYFSGATANFLQPDRQGMSDGPDVYSYVQNNPTNATDPSGELLIISPTATAAEAKELQRSLLTLRSRSATGRALADIADSSSVVFELTVGQLANNVSGGLTAYEAAEIGYSKESGNAYGRSPDECEYTSGGVRHVKIFFDLNNIRAIRSGSPNAANGFLSFNIGHELVHAAQFTLAGGTVDFGFAQQAAEVDVPLLTLVQQYQAVYSISFSSMLFIDVTSSLKGTYGSDYDSHSDVENAISTDIANQLGKSY